MNMGDNPLKRYNSLVLDEHGENSVINNKRDNSLVLDKHGR
jgi:hypothetical protein